MDQKKSVRLVKRPTVTRKILTQENHNDVQLNWFTLKMLQLHIRGMNEVKDYIVHELDIRGYNGLEIMHYLRQGKLRGTYFVIYSDNFSIIQRLKETFSLEEFTVVELQKKIICFKHASQNTPGWDSLQVFQNIVNQGYFIVKVRILVEEQPTIRTVSEYLCDEGIEERPTEEDYQTQQSLPANLGGSSERKILFQRDRIDNRVPMLDLSKSDLRKKQYQEEQKKSVTLQNFLDTYLSQSDQEDESRSAIPRIKKKKSVLKEGPKGLRTVKNAPAFNAIMQCLLNAVPEFNWDQIHLIKGCIEEYFALHSQYNALTLEPLFYNLHYTALKTETKSQRQIEQEMRQIFYRIVQFFRQETSVFEFEDQLAMDLGPNHKPEDYQRGTPLVFLQPNQRNTIVNLSKLLKKELLEQRLIFNKLKKILAVAVRRDQYKFKVKFDAELTIPVELLLKEDSRVRLELIGAVLSDPKESLAVVQWKQNWLLCHDEKIEVLEKEESINCLENEAILYLFRRKDL